MKRHSVTLCSDKRDYNSSGLSRYVPKKSRKISEDLTSEPVDCSEKGIYDSRLDHSVLGSEAKSNSKEARGEDTFLDLQEKNDAGSYMNDSFDESSEGIMSLEKGINASRWDHSVLGSKGKGNFKEAEKGTFLRLQYKNDAGMYRNVSCDDSGEGIICFMQVPLWQDNMLFLESNN